MVREHTVIIITIERRLFVDGLDTYNTKLEQEQLDLSMDNIFQIMEDVFVLFKKALLNKFSFLER